MKKILLMAFVVFSGIVLQAQYKYLGKDISEEKFNNLYEYFNQYLFVDLKTKEVYDIRVDLTGKNKYYDTKLLKRVYASDSPKINDYGEVHGVVFQIVNSQKLLFKIDDNCLVAINCNTANIVDNDSFKFVGIAKRTFAYQSLAGRRTILEFDVLSPIDKKSFAQGIEVNELFKFVEKTNNIPPKMEVCSACSGRGKVNNRSYNKNKMDSKQSVQCTKCNGTGKINAQKSDSEIVFEKVKIED